MSRESETRAGLITSIIFFAVVSLFVLNVYGQTTGSGTLSQREWTHGWPFPWLHRPWSPFVDAAPAIVDHRHPAWPWVNGYVQAHGPNISISALLLDGLIALALLIAAARIPVPRVCEASRMNLSLIVAIVCAAIAIVGLAVIVYPGLLFPLAAFYVYSIAALGGVPILAQVLRFFLEVK
jgi:hypothetical protein